MDVAFYRAKHDYAAIASCASAKKRLELVNCRGKKLACEDKVANEVFAFFEIVADNFHALLACFHDFLCFVAGGLCCQKGIECFVQCVLIEVADCLLKFSKIHTILLSPKNYFLGPIRPLRKAVRYFRQFLSLPRRASTA